MALTRVRYKGLSDIREMSKKDLGEVGVHLDSGLTFDRSNRHTVYIQDPSDDLLTLLKEEGTFTVQEVDEKTEEVKQTIVKHDASKADDTGRQVIQGGSSPTGRTGRGSSTAGS
jgi:hypothetical protein